MEKMTPTDDFLHLDADISTRNAHLLNELNSMYSIPLTEHVRRAISIYTFAVQSFNDGGRVHGITESGPEIIPLFYADDSRSKKDQMAQLSVNINKEAACALKELGLDTNSSETYILDNVINYYAHVMALSNTGHRLVIINKDGSENELVVSGAI